MTFTVSLGAVQQTAQSPGGTHESIHAGRHFPSAGAPPWTRVHAERQLRQRMGGKRSSTDKQGKPANLNRLYQNPQLLPLREAWNSIKEDIEY